MITVLVDDRPVAIAREATGFCMYRGIGKTLILAAVLGLPVAGCGKAAHELDTAKVSGRVTLDGAPLPQGLVCVATTKGRMAKALIEEDGTFQLSTYRKGDGVQIGSHPVIITALPMDELSPQEKQARVKIPKRYARAGTSGLSIDVKAGEKNEVEFVLTSAAE